MNLLTDLPFDIQREIYIRTLILRKPKCVLTDDLKNDIETYHLIYKIFDYYQILYSEKRNNANYYLDWLENDIMSELNDNIPMAVGFTDNFLKAFPGYTPEEIMMEIIEEKHCIHQQLRIIKRYWRHLSYDKRIRLYLSSEQYF